MTKNSKIYKKKGKFNPTETKKEFYGNLESILNGKGLEDSTTAITFNNPDNKFSIDFVIIDGTDGNYWKIIKRNNKNSKNEYTWNSMPDAKNHIYYTDLPDKERYELAKEIINLKARDKALSEDKRHGSYIVTIQAIKEHRDRYEHKN